MNDGWQQYQEEAATFFRSLGMKAETNVKLQGVRTTHDIDVFVTTDVVGFQVKWLIECKHWQKAVTKLHILALREIVSDIGADRGVILCEKGFQSGAVEAANLTNIQATSLADLKVSSKDAIYAARLQELFARSEQSRERYWNIPKEVRIEKGLRFDIGDFPNMYSGARVVDLCRAVLGRAFSGNYPIVLRSLDESAIFQNLPDALYSSVDVVELLEPMLTDLEKRLNSV